MLNVQWAINLQGRLWIQSNCLQCNKSSFTIKQRYVYWDKNNRAIGQHFGFITSSFILAKMCFKKKENVRTKTHFSSSSSSVLAMKNNKNNNDDDGGDGDETVTNRKTIRFWKLIYTKSLVFVWWNFDHGYIYFYWKNMEQSVVWKTGKQWSGAWKPECRKIDTDLPCKTFSGETQRYQLPLYLFRLLKCIHT